MQSEVDGREEGRHHREPYVRVRSRGRIRCARRPEAPERGRQRHDQTRRPQPRHGLQAADGVLRQPERVERLIRDGANGSVMMISSSSFFFLFFFMLTSPSRIRPVTAVTRNHHHAHTHARLLTVTRSARAIHFAYTSPSPSTVAHKKSINSKGCRCRRNFVRHNILLILCSVDVD